MEGWRFRGDERKYLEEVLEKGQMCARFGDMALRFERAFAEKIGSRFAVAVNSGTSTLHAALLASGVGKGDEVIVPALTVIMTAAAVIHTGAVPVFADINPDDYCISPESIRERITDKTKAIIPVPLFGLSCDMEAVMGIAEEFHLSVIEDCAQSLLSSFRGRYAGTWGHVGSFSFEQSKHICTGDGGMVVTDSEELALGMRMYSDHGVSCLSAADGRWQGTPYTMSIGYNYRMPELCAAVGLAQLERIEEIVAQRQGIGRLYAEAIEPAKWLRPQEAGGDRTHAYYLFPIRFVEEAAPVTREEFQRILVGQGVKCKWKPWDKLAYMEPALSEKRLPSTLDYALPTVHYGPGLCPVAERVHGNLFVLPVLYPDRSVPALQAEGLRRAIEAAEKA